LRHTAIVKSCGAHHQRQAGHEEIDADEQTERPSHAARPARPWCGWGGGAGPDGVVIFNLAGRPIGRIDLPERCANACFGGFRRSRLFMAASHAVYSLFVRAQGAFGG
jgi:hypothetical protein